MIAATHASLLRLVAPVAAADAAYDLDAVAAVPASVVVESEHPCVIFFVLLNFVARFLTSFAM
jgi:hypothetical protein